jgi:MOSC domain-containing protein YiiM
LPIPKGPAPDSPIGRLLAAPMRPGELIWIGLRSARKALVLPQTSAVLVAAKGIEGDRYDTRHNGSRQATLIAQEHIAAIASFLGRETIAPDLLRRNLVTRGINLQALKGRRFRIGATVLEATGECAPCSRMEELLGPGGYNAVRGHGGITARIIEGGTVWIGDAITAVVDSKD